MKRIVLKIEKGVILFILIIFSLSIFKSSEILGELQERLPKQGSLIPNISIPVPTTEDDRSYLMLGKQKAFQLGKINTQLLLIEVFNVYCASCQFMRPYMNELYSKIEKDPELKGRVKMIGVGAGNDRWDIELEEDSYEFPIVPDDDYKFHELVGKPPTPFLIFAKPYAQGGVLVVNSHLGRLEDSDKLLSMTRTAFKTDTSKVAVSPLEKEPPKEEPELIIPVSDDEVLKKVRDSLSVEGDKLLDIKSIDLPKLGAIYAGTLMNSKKRVFARVVARKIPCVDCHDVFYIYSFNDDGEFLKFIPISISKWGNEEWDVDDVNKIRNRFENTSLMKEIHFNVKIDAVTSATISTKLIYDSLGETNLVIEKLIDLGYISPKK